MPDTVVPLSCARSPVVTARIRLCAKGVARRQIPTGDSTAKITQLGYQTPAEPPTRPSAALCSSLVAMTGR